VDLSGAEYDLLTVFLDNPKRTLSRERLLELARNRVSVTGTDRSVDVQVSRLRQKLEGENENLSLIKTVRGVGYVFVGDVEG
jgi:two-component system OmpR family response regulator